MLLPATNPSVPSRNTYTPKNHYNLLYISIRYSICMLCMYMYVGVYAAHILFLAVPATVTAKSMTILSLP